MAKIKKRKEPEKAKPVVQKSIPTFSPLQQDLFFIVLLAILFVILLKPMVIDGLSPQGVDVVGSKGASHQTTEFAKKSGGDVLWNPYIFSGMPLYHRKGPVTFSVDTILLFLSRFFSTVYIFYLFGAIGSYLLFRYLKMTPLVSFIATIIFILMPHYKSLYTEGHFAKFRALMFLPWILLSFKYFLDRRSLLAAAMFAIAFGAQIRTQHYQIVFYTAMLIFAVGLYPILKDLLEKRIALFSRSALLVIAAVILGITMSSQPLFLAKEYVPYSKRGKTTISLKQKEKPAADVSADDGVQIEYATQWSTHPSEMLTWLVPRFYGGMSGEEYNGSGVPQLKGRMIPGYWGNMPFTQSYEYMGVVSLLLAVIGIYVYRKNPFIISLLILTGFFILLSFGRHFLAFYSLFFDYFPYFNKFRAPVMSVSVTSFIVAIFAAYGLHFLSSMDIKNTLREYRYLFAIIGGFLGLGILLLIFGQGMSFTHVGDRYDQQVLEMIKKVRKEFFTDDLIRYFLLVIAAGTALFAYLSRKISFTLTAVLLAGFILFDLISIQQRYHKKYIDAGKMEKQHFQQSETDNFLLNDSETFRIFPIGQLFGDNRWAYYHQTIGGYSAIKMYTIEELVENNIYGGWDSRLPLNFNVMKMLNVKYVISQQQFIHENLNLVKTDPRNNLFTYEYNEHLPRGFFVGKYSVITDPYARLNMINNKDFDPAVTAMLEEELADPIQTPDSSFAAVRTFTPDLVEFDVYTNTQALFVISEMDYPPGWKIRIDGQPVDKIYKTDHAIQSVVVPAGNHAVELRFEPDSYYRNIRYSYASAGALYLIVLFSLVMMYKDKLRAIV
ncbi:MAG: hypothetical protein E4H13_12435, partial [Calditrichales bacterium]